MIGNRADATLALSEFLDNNSGYVLSREGTTRCVYIINGVVYKVPHHGYEFDSDAEYANINRYKSVLPAGFAFPSTALYMVGDTPIIAMEYIDGDPVGYCDYEEYGIHCDHLDCVSTKPLDGIAQFNDLCYGNMIMRDGIAYIIDAAR